MCAVDQLLFRALERAFFVGMRQSWISGIECAFIFSVKSTATWVISVVHGTQVRIAFFLFFSCLFERHSNAYYQMRRQPDAFVTGRTSRILRFGAGADFWPRLL